MVQTLNLFVYKCSSFLYVKQPFINARNLLDYHDDSSHNSKCQYRVNVTMNIWRCYSPLNEEFMN